MKIRTKLTCECCGNPLLLTIDLDEIPARKIAEICDRRRWTQKDLAHALGVTASAVTTWKQGIAIPNAPNRKRLEKLLTETRRNYNN